jgi:hypothetical protein
VQKNKEATDLNICCSGEVLLTSGSKVLVAFGCDTVAKDTIDMDRLIFVALSDVGLRDIMCQDLQNM